jgi:hypothetical protein
LLHRVGVAVLALGLGGILAARHSQHGLPGQFAGAILAAEREDLGVTQRQSLLPTTDAMLFASRTLELRLAAASRQVAAASRSAGSNSRNLGLTRFLASALNTAGGRTRHLG